MNFLKRLLDKTTANFGLKWKDWIFATGSIVFTISLIPIIFSPEKPPLITSLPTWFFLWLFVIAHSANKDYKGAFWAFACGLVWLILAIQVLV